MRDTFVDVASGFGLDVSQVVATVMADGQVFLVAVTTFTKRLNVLKCGVGMRHMLPAHPTRHHAMHLARDRFVDFVAGELEPTQGVTSPKQPRSWRKRQSL
jgi:hypothetical protein